LSTRHAVLGGPNINPMNTSLADCIDKAPGNPQIVMVDDELADHVPGCNLAARRSFLQAMGGFDDRYRGGGDDVTFCWTVSALGATSGAAFGAMVWHHRRRTVAEFMLQQVIYGKGEAKLEKDWPERFNAYGHQVQRLSGPGIDRLKAERPAPVELGVYSAASLVDPSGLDRLIGITPTMPEWAILSLFFGLIALLGIRWPLYTMFTVPAAAGFATWLGTACWAALRPQLRNRSLAGYTRLIALHLVQPASRLYGRCLGSMTPWRSRCLPTTFHWPRTRRYAWPVSAESEPARGASHWPLAQALQRAKLPVRRGGGTQPWDWSIEGGILGGVHCLQSGYTIIV
jgi:O-antigen biosynthesis protein